MFGSTIGSFSAVWSRDAEALGDLEAQVIDLGIVDLRDRLIDLPFTVQDPGGKLGPGSRVSVFDREAAFKSWRGTFGFNGEGTGSFGFLIQGRSERLELTVKRPASEDDPVGFQQTFGPFRHDAVPEVLVVEREAIAEESRGGASPERLVAFACCPFCWACSPCS